MTLFPGNTRLKMPGTLTKDHVLWAYRLLLDRDCESDDIIANVLSAISTPRELRVALMTSTEYKSKNPDLAFTNEHNVVIKQLAGGIRIFVDLADLIIGLNVIRDRYEQSEAAFIRDTVKPGQVVLDVGANIGYHTLTLAALVGSAGRVYAFEPDARNADLLQLSIAENRFHDRVVLERLAVGATAGLIKLVTLEHATNSGGSYILEDETRAPKGHQLREVKMISLDSLPIQRPVRFIKIDIEGAEALAFRGARRMLRDDRPTILSEIHPAQLNKVSRCSPEQLVSEMQSLGYRCHLLENGKVTERVSPHHLSAIRNVVFVPSDTQTG